MVSLSNTRPGGSAMRGGAIKNGRHGKFVPAHGLTEQQATFVVNYVANGGNRQQAARTAGYSDPRTESYRLLNLPHIRQAITDERERVLNCELASKALATMSELLGEDTPAQVRFQAARWVLEAVGHGIDSGTLEDHEKPLHEMSYYELNQVIQTALSDSSGRPGSS